MNNFSQTISAHNSKILHNLEPPATPGRTCNCRVKDNCPLDGECLKTSLIYQATVETEDSTPSTYIGLTEGTFKSRYANHKASFTHSTKRHATELSKYVWSLKDNNKLFNIKWRIIKHSPSFNNIFGKFHLCLWEKFYIIFKPGLASLNKRSEMLSTCRHKAKFLLCNYK
jgi:hypothetical protein